MTLQHLNLEPTTRAFGGLAQVNRENRDLREMKSARRRGRTGAIIGGVAGFALAGGPAGAARGAALGSALATGNTGGAIQAGAGFAADAQAQDVATQEQTAVQRSQTLFAGTPSQGEVDQGGFINATDAVAPDPRGAFTSLLGTRFTGQALQGLGRLSTQGGGQTFNTLTPAQTEAAGFGKGAVVQQSNTTGRLTRVRPAPKPSAAVSPADIQASFASGLTAGGHQGEIPQMPSGAAITTPNAFKLGKNTAENNAVGVVIRKMETDLAGTPDRLPSLKQAFTALNRQGTKPAFEKAEELQEEIASIEKARTDQFGPEFNRVAREMGFAGKLTPQQVAQVNQKIESRDVRQAGRIEAAKGAARTETNLDKPLSPATLRELRGPLGARLPIKTTMRQAGGLLLKRAKEAPLNATEREKFGSTADLLADTEEAMGLYQPGWVGPIDGRVTAFRDFTGAATPDRSKFFALVSKWKNIILKLRSGGAVTTGEAQRLDRELPTMNNSDVAFVARMKVFQNSLKKIIARDPRGRSSGAATPRSAPPSKSFIPQQSARLNALDGKLNDGTITDSELDELDGLTGGR